MDVAIGVLIGFFAATVGPVSDHNAFMGLLLFLGMTLPIGTTALLLERFYFQGK